MRLNQGGRKIITYKISISKIGRGIMCKTINTSNTTKQMSNFGKKETLCIFRFPFDLFTTLINSDNERMLKSASPVIAESNVVQPIIRAYQ